MHRPPLRIQLKSLWIDFLDKLRDLRDIAVIVFLIVGLIVAALKVWLIVFGLHP